MLNQDELTEREVEILRLIDAGHSNNDISQQLTLSLHTVKWHIKQVFSKLHVQRRTQAVARAKELGILEQFTLSADPLPTPLIPLIGRQQEIQDLTDSILRCDSRLITIVGLGGVGKTHLALELASNLNYHFNDSVYYVSLAEVESPDELMPYLMMVLGVEDEVIHCLNQRPTLLVLDNCERLRDDMMFLHDLILNAPQLCILATSRERLNLIGENVYHLQGLNTDSACELFAYSAQQTDIDYSIVTRICDAVEGLPLAIVLAASWMNSLSIEEILREVETNFSLLQFASPNLPKRHQNIQHVFDASWKLLTKDEQIALMSLSIFQGTFTRQAIEDIAHIRLPMLSTLISKSFVMQNKRYYLHKLIRLYLLEKLSADIALINRIQQAHSDYYLDLLQHYSRLLKGKNQLHALNMIKQEYPNIQQGWYYALSMGHFQQITSVIDFWLYFEITGRYTEGLELFECAFHALPDDTHTLRGQLQIAIGSLKLRLGQFDVAREALEQSITELNVPDAILAINMLGSNCYLQDKYQKAERYYKEALNLAKHHEDDWCQCVANGNLARLKLKQGYYEEAEHFLLQEQILLKRSEDYYRRAFNLIHQGDLARDKQRYRIAEAFYLQSMEISTQTGHRQLIAMAHQQLGLLAEIEGYDERSLDYLQHAYETYESIHHLMGMHTTLCLMIEVLIGQANLEAIYVHLGKADHISEMLGEKYQINIWFLFSQFSIQRQEFSEAMFALARIYQHEATNAAMRLSVQAQYEDIKLLTDEAFPPIGDVQFSQCPYKSAPIPLEA